MKDEALEDPQRSSFKSVKFGYTKFHVKEIVNACKLIVLGPCDLYSQRIRAAPTW